MAGPCKICIGTSGWHYKHWVGDFYPLRFPPAKMLSRYSEEFCTVEINNSFYRLPDENTFGNWARQVPPGFLFAVKASRFITHIKRLKDSGDSVNLLLERCRPLGASLGPILFQLPPRWKLDMERLTDFLQVLPPGRQYGIEFRDPSWCSHQVYEMLRRHNVALACMTGEKWRGHRN